MNKIIWYILIPSAIFAGILVVLGFALESQHFYWLQNFEMIYLFMSLLIGFISFRIWRLGVQFRQMRELKILLGLLFLIFAADLINTSIYLLEGHSLFWENNHISPAGAAFTGSMLFVLLAFIGLRNQIRLARQKSQ